MKKLIILTASFCLCLIGTAQDNETRTVEQFEGISVSASVDAELVKGNQNQVVITVENVDLDRVKTEVKDGVLHVGMKKSKSGWGWNKKNKVHAVITYTDDPEYISVSSSADVIGRDVIRTSELELKASSSGDMALEVDTDELRATVSSSADLSLSGSANEARITVSSSGDFVGKNLDVNDAHVTASSSGDASVSVSGTIEARASSSGDIVYYGKPEHKDISKSSGGSVEARN